MPYIDEASKRRLDDPNCRTRVKHARGAGQLTYKLQQELKRYIEDHGLKYETLAACLGALEGAKIDLTERVVKPYEARKREENGDVWPLSLAPEPLQKARVNQFEVLPLDDSQIEKLAALTGAPGYNDIQLEGPD